MKSWLTNATKKRVIQEIRDILYNHPRYREDHLNVQNKYSFNERPKRGVIVDGTAADRVRLSADNYIGRLSSFVMAVPHNGKSGRSIEWVRENFTALEQVSADRSVFPSQPGAYIIKIVSVPVIGTDTPGTFTIDPIFTVHGEPLILFETSGDFEAQISRENIYPGSTRLWINYGHKLIRGVDYQVNEETGTVLFLKSTPTGSTIHADYRYITPTIGPLPFKNEESIDNAIPGAILAFGDRCEIGDEIAIIVTEDRTEVSEVFGGKYEINFSLTAFVHNDSEDREKLSDYIIHSFLDRQNILGFEGLELLDISPGGENEEIYNADDDTYFYESYISLSLRFDWETYVPLPIVVSGVETVSSQSEQSYGWLEGPPKEDLLQAVSSVLDSLPVNIGKKLYYERIK